MCNANYLRNYSCKHLIFRTPGVLHTMQVAKAKYQERGRRTSFLVSSKYWDLQVFSTKRRTWESLAAGFCQAREGLAIGTYGSISRRWWMAPWQWTWAILDSFHTWHNYPLQTQFINISSCAMQAVWKLKANKSRAKLSKYVKTRKWNEMKTFQKRLLNTGVLQRTGSECNAAWCGGLPRDDVT